MEGIKEEEAAEKLRKTRRNCEMKKKIFRGEVENFIFISAFLVPENNKIQAAAHV